METEVEESSKKDSKDTEKEGLEECKEEHPEKEEDKQEEDKQEEDKQEEDKQVEDKGEEEDEGESWLELSMAEMELLQRMEEANRFFSSFPKCSHHHNHYYQCFLNLIFTRLIECDSKSLASLPSSTSNCNSTNSTSSSVHSRSSSECRSEVGFPSSLFVRECFKHFEE